MKILAFIFMFIATISQAREVGEVKTSGIMFKDSIEIHSFKDPTLDGVACHVTITDRAMSFDDQTDTSIACRQVKKTITGDYKSKATDLFSKNKNLFFKTMTVDRFYDSENDVLVYIAYTKKVKGDNASHSISTVPLYTVH